jgi:hypothetical protein
MLEEMCIYLPDVGPSKKGAAKPSSLAGLPGTSGTTNEVKGVWRLPCSRGDVFQSKLLGAMEKRQVLRYHCFT